MRLPYSHHQKLTFLGHTWECTGLASVRGRPGKPTGVVFVGEGGRRRRRQKKGHTCGGRPHPKAKRSEGFSHDQG